MASNMNFVCLIFFLTLLGKGMCFRLCPNNEVFIDQSATGNNVGGEPEWKLTLSSDCPCPQTDVKLTCAGFQAVQNPDPSIFTKNGDTCSITPSVTAFKPVSFTYAADTIFDFDLISSKASC